MKLLLLLAFVTVTFWACGDGDRPEVVPPGSSGRGSVPGQGGKSGSLGQGGAGEAGADQAPGGRGGEGGEDSRLPQVQILSPGAALEPSSHEVLIGAEVDVLCKIAPGDDAFPIDASSVVVEMLDAEDVSVADAAGVATQEPYQYAASFLLAKVPTGRVSFRCGGSTRGRPSFSGEDTVETFVDHGPAIELASPLPDSVHALAGAVPVEFTVTPEPLANRDEGAEVDEVVLLVNGREFEVDQIDDSPLTFATSVDFSDRTLFPDVLMGSIPVEVRATNQRKPTPAVNKVNYNFVLDGAPPIIEIKSPVADAVIGGKQVVLRFSVVDGLSSVVEESVVVSLNTEEYRFGKGIWARSGNEFSFTFDSTQVSGSKWQVTVNITARDAAGNATKISKNFYLDNVAPVVDLDPEPVREQKRNGECSQLFDPVGDAEDDRSVVFPAPLLRALVWDLTNSVSGASVLHYSGVDEDSVRLYVQPDLGAKLLTDETGDGICDAIASQGLTAQKLKAVPAAGTSRFIPIPQQQLPLGCVSPTSSNSPTPLCNNVSDLTRVISHSLGGSERAIYGIGDLQSLECTGAHWEISAIVKREGWACLAAEARDNVGNLGVSPPFRVCIDDGVGVAPDCSLNSMPSCTDGCSSVSLPSLIIGIN